MIGVQQANEPNQFNASVRTPGMAYLASLLPHQRPDFRNRNYWKTILRDLHAAYGGICAYTCHWMAYDVGSDTVEHFRPKSAYPNLAYEWTNYRLVCSRMNARKGRFEDVIDPFDVTPGMFTLHFPSLNVVTGSNLTNTQRTLVETTIRRLRLNDPRSIDTRQEYVKSYLAKHISAAYLRDKAPFLMSELVRQSLDKRKLKKIFK